MRIWVDISNSPQVPFFRPLIALMRERGYEVAVTTREYATLVMLNSSMMEAIKMRSGYLSFTFFSSSTHTSKLRSLISSMFSQPMISFESRARRRAYRRGFPA